MGKEVSNAFRVARHNTKLATLLTYGKDVYIDTCALEPSSSLDSGLFSDYRLAIINSVIEKTGGLKREMLEHGHNLSKHLAHSNAHIISEVSKEAQAYFDLAHKDINRAIQNGEKDAWRNPLRILEGAILKNNERFVRGGRERSYLIDNILEILPYEIETTSKNPTLTDRKLVAVAFTEGITSGKDKTILAYDGGVAATLSTLSEVLKQDPRALSMKRARKGIKPFDVQVTTFKPKNGKRTIQRTAYFEKTHPFFK